MPDCRLSVCLYLSYQDKMITPIVWAFLCVASYTKESMPEYVSFLMVAGTDSATTGMASVKRADQATESSRHGYSSLRCRGGRRRDLRAFRYQLGPSRSGDTEYT